MKTLIIGNFGAGNRGDDLILLASQYDYPKNIVMTSEKENLELFLEQKIDTVNMFPTGFRSFFKWIFDGKNRDSIKRIVPEIKTIVFAGGGLFAIKFKACFLWFLVFLWSKRYFPKAEIRFEYQGVDNNLDYFSKKMIKYVFSHSDFVSVRDDYSKKAVKEIVGIDVNDVGDRVEKAFEKGLYDSFKKQVSKDIIIINAVSLFEWGISKRNFVFVAFEEKDLRTVPNDFLGKVVYPKTVTELFHLFSRSEKVIGERFHSLVIGLSICGKEKTYLLRDPYSEKVRTFAENNKINRIDFESL